jgi:hypothetical protein
MTKPKRPPKTIKEQRFVKALSESVTYTEAARKAGYKDPVQAAYENKIKLDTSALMDKAGLTDDRLFEKLDALVEAQRTVSAIGGKDANAGTVDFVDVPDNPVQLKALEMAFKLKDKFPSSKVDQTVTVVEVKGLEKI